MTTAPGLMPAPGPLPASWGRRLSTGHLVMIVSGLLATVLVYSVLRQAGAKGTQVLVAAQPIPAGSTVAASMLTSTTVKASSGTLGSLEQPAAEPSLLGRIAAVDVGRGQLLEPGEFRSAAVQSPRMTIQIDPQAIPGGVSGLQVGSSVDVIAVTAAGTPVEITGLVVVQPPSLVSRSDQALAADATTVPIEVAVPDLVTAAELYEATTSKFEIRVSPPALPGAPQATPSSLMLPANPAPSLPASPVGRSPGPVAGSGSSPGSGPGAGVATSPAAPGRAAG